MYIHPMLYYNRSKEGKSDRPGPAPAPHIDNSTPRPVTDGRPPRAYTTRGTRTAHTTPPTDARHARNTAGT